MGGNFNNYMANKAEFYTSELTTRPRQEAGTVLVTGANGYIGGRLVPELLSRGYKVRIMVRRCSRGLSERWPGAQYIVADACNPEELNAALYGINVAYYLIHSLVLGHKKFESTDLRAAENFRNAAERQGLQRIIYLGGLGNEKSLLSPHLFNRMQVARILSAGRVPVTILRAGMIIGSGSASYEILKNLVTNSPVYFIPKWANTRSQPIAVRDVIIYLVGVLELDCTIGKSYDIGGSDILTYREMLMVFAGILGKKKIYLPSFTNSTSFYGYIAGLITPVSGPIANVLMAGCKNEVICKNNDITVTINHQVLSFDEAIRNALASEERGSVSTRWTDSYPPTHNISPTLKEVSSTLLYSKALRIKTRKKPADIYPSFCHVGAKRRGFHGNWFWMLQGFIDKLMMGVGNSRGMRSCMSLRINDVIGFWRVEDIQKDKLLLLRSELKLPGMAWLEFRIEEKATGNVVAANVYFKPRGVGGVLYWYMLLPLHTMVFNSILKRVERDS